MSLIISRRLRNHHSPVHLHTKNKNIWPEYIDVGVPQQVSRVSTFDINFLVGNLAGTRNKGLKIICTTVDVLVSALGL